MRRYVFFLNIYVFCVRKSPKGRLVLLKECVHYVLCQFPLHYKGFKIKHKDNEMVDKRIKHEKYDNTERLQIQHYAHKGVLK